MDDSLKNMNSKKEKLIYFFNNAVKCLHSILSKSDEYTKCILHLGGINNRNVNINNRREYIGPLVYSY